MEKAIAATQLERVHGRVETLIPIIPLIGIIKISLQLAADSSDTIVKDF